MIASMTGTGGSTCERRRVIVKSECAPTGGRRTGGGRGCTSAALWQRPRCAARGRGDAAPGSVCDAWRHALYFDAPSREVAYEYGSSLLGCPRPIL